MLIRSKLIARGIAFGVAMTLGTLVHAQSINQGMVSVQAQTGVEGLITFEFYDLSTADFFDLDNNGKVTSGDVMLGAFTLSQVVSSAGLGGAASLTDVSGVYALEVVSAPGGNGAYGFAPLSASADTAVGGITGTAPSAILPSGAMYSVHQGGAPTNAAALPASGSFYNPAYSDGDHYVALAPTIGYTLSFISDDLATINGLPAGAVFASIIPGSGQDVLDNGLGDGGEGVGQHALSPIGILASDTDIAGGFITSSVAISAIGGDAVFNDTVTFQLAAEVPEPSALLLLIAGLPALSRRRRYQ